MILLPTRMADTLYSSTLQALPAPCGFTQSPSPRPLQHGLSETVIGDR